MQTPSCEVSRFAPRAGRDARFCQHCGIEREEHDGEDLTCPADAKERQREAFRFILDCLPQ